MSQDNEGLLADNSIDVPLLDFYTKHRPLPSGKPLAKLLFYYLLATAHEYYSLQLSRRYSTMFLCIVNEADMGAHLQVAALSTHSILNVQPIPDPSATPAQVQQTAALTKKLQDQAALKERNPPRLLSVALHFYAQEGGSVFTYHHLIDMQCRGACGKLGTATCSRCHTARYCSKSCQDMHWKAGHKSVCKPLME